MSTQSTKPRRRQSERSWAREQDLLMAWITKQVTAPRPLHPTYLRNRLNKRLAAYRWAVSSAAIDSARAYLRDTTPTIRGDFVRGYVAAEHTLADLQLPSYRGEVARQRRGAGRRS